MLMPKRWPGQTPCTDVEWAASCAGNNMRRGTVNALGTAFRAGSGGEQFEIRSVDKCPGIVNWALVKVRMASIGRRAGLSSPVDLDGPEVVRAGARAFSERGCTNCHGAPGVKWQKFSEGLNPDPPDLEEIAPERASPPSSSGWSRTASR